MENNPRSKQIDLAAVGVVLFLIGVLGIASCQAILALSATPIHLDNKAEDRR